jgi:PAS domain S-box-containing protein
MNFKNLNIASKIWLPFSAFLILIFGAIVLYYPKKQREVFEEKKNTEMREIVKTVALGVELSLKNDDFQGLRKTLDFVEDRADFEFVSIVLDEFESPEVFLSFPEKIDRESILNPNSEELLIRDESFTTDDFRGFIRLGVSKKQINQQIKLLNSPVYIILFIGLMTSLVLFYFLAQFISKPLSFVTQVARQLEQGNFEVYIESTEGNNEVALLNHALVSLRDKLKKEREINDQLTADLEQKVDLRTAELMKVAQNLSQAQRVSGMGSFSFNFKTKKWEGSESLTEIIGFSAKSGNLLSWSRIMPPKLFRDLIDYFSNPEHYTNRFSTDSIIQIENEEKWITITCELVLDELTQEPKEIQGTIQDITSRKQAEAEIRKLSLVAEKTSNSVIITDVNKRIIWGNEALTKLTGYSLDEIIGKTPRIFQFEKTDQQTVQFINEQIEKQEPVTAELLNRGKYGAEYWLEINIVPLFDENSQLYGYIAVETDITSRKESEEIIKKSEENYRKILDNSAELIHTLDVNGNVLWANNAWLDNMEVSVEEARGKNITEFLSSETLVEFREVMPKLAQGQTVSNLDCRFISSKKREVYLIGKALPIFEDGIYIGSQAYLRNITEAVLAEKQLSRIKEFQNFLMQLSTEFLSINEDGFENKLNASLRQLNTLSDACASAIYLNSEEKQLTLNSFCTSNSSLSFRFKEKISAEFTANLTQLEQGIVTEIIEQDEENSRDLNFISIPLNSTNYPIGQFILVFPRQDALSDNFMNLVQLYSQIVSNTFERLAYFKQLIDSKREIEEINYTLEQKVLENTRKNIELSKTLVDQEKLATIGEISAGIAHDLNTPLGAIKVGAESIDFSLKQFLHEDLSLVNSLELQKLYDWAGKKLHSQFYGGLALRKNQQIIQDYLRQKFNFNEDELNEISEGIVRCQIQPDDTELIDQLIAMPNRKEMINLFFHFQTMRSMMNTIQTSIQKSIQVIQDIKSFSRNDFHDVKKPVNLHSNLTTVLNVLKYEITKNVELSYEVSDTLFVLGFEVKLFQLWSNIIKNAIDAMDNQENKQLRIHAYETEHEIAVSIQNNGPMIPEEIQDKIFRKFFSSKTKKNGTGLGLSIVQNVIDEHNAKINLDSNKEFTKFTVFFTKR